MSNYDEFIGRRMAYSVGEGIDDARLSEKLFPHQRDLVTWALKRGRAAIFADTGLGKTLMQLEWARVVSERLGRVIVLTPLAVAKQTVREGKRFGIACEFDQTGSSVAPIVVTNYEHLDKFAALSLFGGVVIDESSILKNYTGATRNAIIEAFSQTPMRLACTATPAPNDHMELGNHSEFLGVKSRVEMLAEYFTHDGGSTQDWRLKGHAEDAYWRWVCSWAAMVRMPSDLGYEDGDYKLPPMRMLEHVIPVDHRDAWSAGYLFAPDATTLSEQRATRRMTMEKRAAKVAELCSDGEQAIVWCELNDEADAIEAAIPDAVQVKGSDSPEQKEDRLLGFADGGVRVLVTKPSIAGFGMNWQRCSRVIFAGASHSYEQTYQAIRRCWRFGQKRPVDVHVIRAETESAITQNFKRKEADAERMRAAMLEHMRAAQDESFGRVKREWNAYNPQVTMTIPSWIGEER